MKGFRGLELTYFKQYSSLTQHQCKNFGNSMNLVTDKKIWIV